MVQHYRNRFKWIFRYTSKNIGYCIAKTLCIVVGLPIYLVCFCAEMALTLVNMLLCWIPGINILAMLICKALMWIVDKPYYICVLTDLKQACAPNQDIPDYADFTYLSQSQTDENIADATDIDHVPPQSITDVTADVPTGDTVEPDITTADVMIDITTDTATK